MADMEFEDVDGGKRTCGISERPNGVETSSGMQSMTRTGRSISAIHQLRKSNKPLMEKRRRERINNCLDQLKSILMEVTKKESSYYSKLEKADILEMTVKYLKNLKRQHTMMATRAAPTVAASGIANENRHPQACSILVDRVTSATIDDDEFETGLGFDFKIPPFDVSAKESLSRYMAGYSECASEVSKYLASADTPMPIGDGCNDRNRKVLSDAALDDEARNCLLGHLANNLSWSKAVAAVAAAKSAPSLPSFPVGRPLNSSSPDTTSPATTVSGSGKLTTRDYQSAPQTKCSEAVSGSPLPPTLTPTSASYRTGDLAVNSHGPATSATKPVSSSPLQVVVPARLSSGEVIYVLASPISNIAAATDLPNSPIADNVELSSLGIKSTSGIVLPVVAQQAGNGSDGSKPAAGDDGRGGSFIRGPNHESLTYFRSTTSPSAVAPLDFSRSSVKNANSVRQQPILAGSPSQLTENGLSQSQRVLVNDQIVLRWTGHVGQTMNGCVTTDNEDLMNNNDPCFQSMWRPW